MERGEFGNPGENMQDFVGRAEDEAKKKYFELERLASENTEESRQKLLAIAQEHRVPVRPNMGSGEIKNKIKAALRNRS